MRKTLNILAWSSVVITIASLVLTLLTTYKFFYVKYFDSYYTLQWCTSITMLIWGINFFDFETRNRTMSYSILCMIIAIGNIFFIFMKVR